MQATTHERNARLWKRTLLADRRAGKNPPHLRHLTPKDIPALGALFFNAFLGTIDDAGQTETQYASKATSIIEGQYGEWIPAASWTIEHTGRLRSACLVCDYKPYGCPVIAVVATTPSHKQSGDGRMLVNAALSSLATLGFQECSAMITVGNDPSERLFGSLGFLPQAD
ncbi:GNAT family N-acetyltransferase [Caballeronia sp. KNU42]